jgi:hypothetical protein
MVSSGKKRHHARFFPQAKIADMKTFKTYTKVTPQIGSQVGFTKKGDVVIIDLITIWVKSTKRSFSYRVEARASNMAARGKLRRKMVGLAYFNEFTKRLFINEALQFIIRSQY